MSASLSPTSVLASPAHVNPQVSSDLQARAPQLAQDAQKAVKAVKTDTVTISPQALKMADDKNAAATEARIKADDQRALRYKEDAAKSTAQKSTLKTAYAAYG